MSESKQNNQQDESKEDEKKKGFAATNPATGEKISEYSYIRDEELKVVVEKAWNAFLKLKDADLKERVDKLNKVGDLLEQNAENHAKLITQQMGKPIKQAKQEIEQCVEFCRYYAKNAEEFLKPQEIKTSAKKSYISFEPLGIIYQLVPFNFPYLLTFWSAAAAIVVGNSIIHRNASSCPDIGLALEKLFIEAGFNNGEFINVFTDHDQTNSLLGNDKIRGVTFTGSTSAGAKIAKEAGKNIKKAVMELGGSDPVIILDDAEIDKAVDVAVDARLINGGQVCTAGKRIIIDDKIYDKFVEKLVEKVKNYRVDDPSKEDAQMGPLAHSGLLDTIMDQVKRGISEGGNLLYGGEKMESGNFSNGYFYKPTIVECKEGNILLKEETFGPVFALTRAKDEKEAIQMANDTEYGLSAIIVSNDTKRAEGIAKQIDAGSVFINKNWEPSVNMPFGGVKASGIGRECGEHGLQEFANIKCIAID